MSCAIEKAVKEGALLEEDRQVFTLSIPDILKKIGKGGVVGYGDFYRFLATDPDYGPRFLQHSVSLWKEVTQFYKGAHKEAMGGLPRLAVGDRDVTPDYAFLRDKGATRTPSDFETAVIEDLHRMRDTGILREARGGVNKRSWDVAMGAAQALVKEDGGFTAERLSGIGVSGDELASYIALHISQTRERIAGINEALKGATEPETRASLEAQAALANEHLVGVIALASGNKTEWGRSLRASAMIDRAITGGSDKAREFLETFGYGPTSQETDPWMASALGRKWAMDNLKKNAPHVQEAIRGENVSLPEDHAAGYEGSVYKKPGVAVVSDVPPQAPTSPRETPVAPVAVDSPPAAPAAPVRRSAAPVPGVGAMGPSTPAPQPSRVRPIAPPAGPTTTAPAPQVVPVPRGTTPPSAPPVAASPSEAAKTGKPLDLSWKPKVAGPTPIDLNAKPVPGKAPVSRPAAPTPSRPTTPRAAPEPNPRLEARKKAEEFAQRFAAKIDAAPDGGSSWRSVASSVRDKLQAMGGLIERAVRKEEC